MDGFFICNAKTIESLGRASNSMIFLPSSFSILSIILAKKVPSSTSLIRTRSIEVSKPFKINPIRSCVKGLSFFTWFIVIFIAFPIAGSTYMTNVFCSLPRNKAHPLEVGITPFTETSKDSLLISSLFNFKHSFAST